MAVGQNGTVDVWNGTTWTATTGNGGSGMLAGVSCLDTTSATRPASRASRSPRPTAAPAGRCRPAAARRQPDERRLVLVRDDVRRRGRRLGNATTLSASTFVGATNLKVERDRLPRRLYMTDAPTNDQTVLVRTISTTGTASTGITFTPPSRA